MQEDDFRTNLLVRVGRKNPLYPKKSKSPYSYHEWIPVSKLILELNKILDGQNHNSMDFPYYLMLFEFVPKAMKDIWYPFKYIGLLDLEPQVGIVENIQHYLQDKYKDFIKQWTPNEIAMWFTGNKGYRMGFPNRHRDSCFQYLVYTGLPKEEYNKEVDRRVDSNLISYFYPKGNEQMSTELPGFDASERRIFKYRLVDRSIYVPGHGVKADILPHANTNSLQLWLGRSNFAAGNLPMIIRESKAASEPTPASWDQQQIIKFWILLLQSVENSFQQYALSFKKIADTYPKRDEHFKLDISLNRKCRERMIESSLKKSYDLGDVPLMKTLGSKCTLRIKSSSGSELFCFEDKYCPIHERCHAVPKHYYVLSNVRANNVICFCHSNSLWNQCGKLMPLKDRKHFFREQSGVEEDNPFLNDLERLGLLHSGSYIPLNQEYLGDILEDDRVKNKKYIFLESGMGTGKTESVAKYLKDHTNYTTSRVGASSSRICFSNAVSDRWNLKSYAEFGQEKRFTEQKKNLASFNRICISMESLDKLAIPGTRNILPFDVWILDESETLLGNFNSETMESKRRNYLTFINILKATKDKVFIMDAFMGSKTLEFFKTSGVLNDPNEYVFIQNFKNKDQANWEILTPPEWPNFLQWMFFDLMNKRKIALVCDSKKQIVKIVDHLIEETKKKGLTFEWLMITGSSDDATKSTSIDCSSWSAFDLIAYTPAITVGNSCSIPFWKIYGSYHGIVNARTFLQMMARLRDITSNLRVVLVDTTKKNKPLLIQSKEEIANHLRKKDLNIMKEARYLIDEGFTCLDAAFLSIPNPNKCLNELFINNCEEDIRSQVDPKTALTNALSQTHAEWSEMVGENESCEQYKQFKRDKIDLKTIDTSLKDNQLLRQYKEQLNDLYFKSDYYENKTAEELYLILEDFNHLTGRQLWHHYLLSHYEEIPENLFLEQLEERVKAKDLGNIEIIQYAELMKSLRSVNRKMELTGKYHKGLFFVDLFNLQKDKDFMKAITRFFENENNLKLWNFDAKIFFDPDESDVKRRLDTYIKYVLPYFGICYEKIPEKKNAEFVQKHAPKTNHIFSARSRPKFKRNSIYVLNCERLTHTQFAAYRKHSITDKVNPIDLVMTVDLQSKYQDFLRTRETNNNNNAIFP